MKKPRGALQFSSQMRNWFPDREQMEVVSVEAAGAYCRRPHWNEGAKIFSKAPRAVLRHLSPGQRVTVEYLEGNRQFPFISGFTGGGRAPGGGTPPVIIYAQWLQPEASSRIACRSLIAQPQLKLSTASTMTELATLDRTLDESAFAFDQTYTDVLGLLMFSHGGTTHQILACLYAVWDSSASLTGATLRVKEHALAGTAFTPETVTIDVTRWLGTNGIWPNRSAGYLFADKVGDDIIYTVAVEAGIVAYRRSISAVKITSEWVEDARRFAGRAGSIGCVQQYLIECGYSAPKVLDEFEPGGARLQLYTRDAELAYQAAAPIELMDLFPGSSSGSVSRRTIFPVGLLQPQSEYIAPGEEDPEDGGWAHNLLSSRWPMLVSGARREWWIYLNCIASEENVDPHWLTVAVDAVTATAEVVDTFEPDFTWRMLFEDLVATKSAGLEEAAEATRFYEISGWPPVSGLPEYTPESFPAGATSVGPTEFVEIDVTVHPGDPGADPPVPPQVEPFGYWISGFLAGWDYTGFSPQATGVDLDSGFAHTERFYAAPMPGISAPSGDEYTSSQCPAGVFSESGLHFGVCFEPQHYVNDLALVDNIPSEDRLYSDSVSYLKFGDTHVSEDPNPGALQYLWWITKGISGVTGEIFDVDPPHFYLSGDPDNDPNGETLDGTPAGNTSLGPIDIILTRFYAVKRHAEYAYEMRYRTWVNVCNPDKTPKFRHDISKYYVDGGAGDFPSRLQSPQLLNVWQWLASGSYLWVLRQDFRSLLGVPLETGDNCVEATQEPFVELWEIGEADLTLLHRLALHPTTDEEAEYTDGSLGHQPRMLVGVDLAGRPYATVWTEWTSESVPQAHLITEVLLDSGGLVRSEKWGTGQKPAGQPIAVEASNSVHHNGSLYWIEGGTKLVGKSSS